MAANTMQRNLPPMLVNPVSPVAAKVAVKRLNPLNLVRQAREKCGMKLASMADAMGISEPLLSAQLSEQEGTKHLSVRRMTGIEDVSFWREFALLILEDLGFTVVLVTPEQKSALTDLQAASAQYAKVSAR